IHDAESRLAFLDIAAQIVDETTDLQLARGAVVDAFRVADHFRFLGAPDLAPQTETRASPPNVALVEYVVGPHTMTVFCASNGVVSADTVPSERQRLASAVETFTDAVRRRASIDETRREGASLYRVLIGPVRQRLAGITELVIVPERELFSVPFSALWD